MCVSLKTGILGDGMINYQLSDKWYKVFSTFSVSYLNIFSMVILRLQWLFSPNFSSETWPCYQNCSRPGSAGGPAALNLRLAGGAASQGSSQSLQRLCQHIVMQEPGNNALSSLASWAKWLPAFQVDTNTSCQRNVSRVGTVLFGDQSPSRHPGDLWSRLQPRLYVSDSGCGNFGVNFRKFKDNMSIFFWSSSFPSSFTSCTITRISRKTQRQHLVIGCLIKNFTGIMRLK